MRTVRLSPHLSASDVNLAPLTRAEWLTEHAELAHDLQAIIARLMRLKVLSPLRHLQDELFILERLATEVACGLAVRRDYGAENLAAPIDMAGFIAALRRTDQ